MNYLVSQAHAADSASVVTMGVASDNVFYVVNPDGNLPETQTRWSSYCSYSEHLTFPHQAGQGVPRLPAMGRSGRGGACQGGVGEGLAEEGRLHVLWSW